MPLVLNLVAAPKHAEFMCVPHVQFHNTECLVCHVPDCWKDKRGN